MNNQVMDFYNNDSNLPFEMSFGQNGKTVGTMRFIGGEMKFEGEADSSASVFIDMIVKKQSAQWREATSRISELEAKCAALAAENAALKLKGRELLGEACSVYEKFNATVDHEVGNFADGQTLQEFDFLLSVGVPVTDAFLAEVRPSAVDGAIAELNQLAERSEKEAPIAAEHHRSAALYLHLFAVQLRREASK